jgi:thiol-disulfide isomerase/thioredoxin
VRFAIFLLALVPVVRAGIVADVRAAIAQNDFALAQQRLDTHRSEKGVTPEMTLALSWMGRGALARKDLDKADAYAAETRKLVLDELRRRKLDADKELPLALGASIEVQASVLAERGQRAEAVAFLTRELKAWGDTSIHARIQKNLNLLTLDGKPAPPLDVASWLGPKPPALQALVGHPVLLFFWAHWCPDCTAEIPALVKIEAEYGPRGLVLIGPTQHYGYVAHGEEASPEVELRYIDQVRQQAYAPLKNMPVPVGEANFQRYGASTVPTLVLIDRRGVVRLYHPGQMSYADLAAAVASALAK